MVDIVITWVNGSDPDWKDRFESFSVLYDGDKRSVRFRDWELLPYWFRGVEKYAPWVRKIFFITEGHLPSWLNTKAPKLRIVKHQDFIPKEDLPLFNSRAIEVNLHRIHDLSEHFVYFNDDFFIINSIKESFFFKKGMPRDIAILNAIDGGGVSDAIIENLKIINRHFRKREVLLTHPFKWINLKYGINLLRTFLLLPWPNFTGFYDSHLPTPYLKSTFSTIWSLENEILKKTSGSKFRTKGTVNPYIFRYWQLVSGNFSPFNPLFKAVYKELTDDNRESIVEIIKKKKKSIIVLNDNADLTDFTMYKNCLIEAFNAILPSKSEYEL